MDEQERWRLFYEIFDGSLPRLGAGDDASTLRALDTLLDRRRRLGSGVPADGLRVLDVGCGNGAQTLQLARHIEGKIVALDNHRPYLDELERRARAEGLSDKIEVRLKSMHDLGDEDGLFDLVWAEGSLFVMGFREGIGVCSRRLAPGGAMAVSELAWLRPERPAECQQYFDATYPAMLDLSATEALIADCGLRLIERFVLPPSSWWTEYYHPLGHRLESFRVAHAADPERLEIIGSMQTEIEMYRNYSDFYGYVFFLAECSHAGAC